MMGGTAVARGEGVHTALPAFSHGKTMMGGTAAGVHEGQGVAHALSAMEKP